MNIVQKCSGDNFTFFIFDEQNSLYIGLSSEYVYPSVNREELQRLADSIIDFLKTTSAKDNTNKSSKS